MSPKPFKLGDKCRRGHLLTEQNTYYEGTRLRCKDCRALWKPSSRVTKAQLTHCPKNHEYTPENTYVDGRGYKHCRTCARERMQGRRTPGLGQGGFNAAKTHCPKNHEYTPDNTYVNPQGRRWCRTCMRANGKLQNVKRYGLTPEQFEQMLANQDNRCAICRAEFLGHAKKNIDHDHTCCPTQMSCGKCVRGILCTECNHGLGRFRDDPEILQAAIDYLMRHQPTDNE